MSDPQTIDGTAEEIGSEMERYEPAPAPSTLFRTDDPVEVVQRASRAAGALADVIEQRQLYKQIQGRKHVLVEGWTTLGSMLGVVPVVVWSRPTGESVSYTVNVRERSGKTSSYEVAGQDWEARVEARTLDGRVVGAAEATCSRKESTWAKRDDYALRSMAQTRATSKALRGPLGFIVTLAGYEATPEAEMPAEAPQEAKPDLITPEQYKALVAAFKDSTVHPAQLAKWLDEENAPAHENLSERITMLDSGLAKRCQKWLEGQREGMTV